MPTTTATQTTNTPSREFNRCQHIFNPESDLARRGFSIAMPHDQASLHDSLCQIIHRIATNQLDPHRASLLLYSLQLAGRHLP